MADTVKPLTEKQVQTAVDVANTARVTCDNWFTRGVSYIPVLGSVTSTVCGSFFLESRCKHAAVNALGFSDTDANNGITKNTSSASTSSKREAIDETDKATLDRATELLKARTQKHFATADIARNALTVAGIVAAVATCVLLGVLPITPVVLGIAGANALLFVILTLVGVATRASANDQWSHPNRPEIITLCNSVASSIGELGSGSSGSVGGSVGGGELGGSSGGVGGLGGGEQ